MPTFYHLMSKLERKLKLFFIVLIQIRLDIYKKSWLEDLVLKDVLLFQAIADKHQVPLELSPLLVEIFRDGALKYGMREFSPNIIRRLEDRLNVKVLADGFPAEMTDDEPETEGYEVRV